MKDHTYVILFRCFYANNSSTSHIHELPLYAIPRWIESYKFTYPSCISISVKVWFHEEDTNE